MRVSVSGVLGDVRLPIAADDVGVGGDCATGGGVKGVGLTSHVGGEGLGTLDPAFKAARPVAVLVAVVVHLGCHFAGHGPLAVEERRGSVGGPDVCANDALEVEFESAVTEGGF